MQHLLNAFPYIQKLLELDKTYDNRQEFHQKVAPLLLEMGQDSDFLKAVI